MADELRVLERPALTRPVLVAAFRGWNDGGQGASLAGGYLAKTWSAERFAEIDPEGFFDFQSTRPHVSLDRRADAPDRLARERLLPRRRSLEPIAMSILLLGIEPNLRWRDLLGADRRAWPRISAWRWWSRSAPLLADVPHTRAAPVTGSATDPALVEQLGLSASRYEGPTGIVGILHDGCREAGIQSVSLWAAVPHYVSLTPSPRAAKALCERLGQLLEADVDVDDLDEAAEAYAEQVSEAVAADSETAAYVEELERRADEADEEQEMQIPSGDTLAAELTRYLQEHEARKREEEDEQPES